MDFLHIDQGATLQLTRDDFIGSKCAILGVAGTGKTNSAARILEQLLARGLPMTILDIEGEYWSLKEKFELLIAGRGEHVDMEMDVSEAGALAGLAWSKNLAIVLDVSDYDETERNRFVVEYFNALWDAAMKESKAYLVVLEEAHEFVAQVGGDPDVKKILSRFSLRGRKRGIGMVMISQRSAKVNKDVLTQARMAFLHRVYHPTDLKVYQEMLPLKPSEVEAMVAGLSTGQCIFYHENTVRVVTMAKRETYHAGATPGLDQQHAQQLRVVDESLLDELRKLAPKAADAVAESEPNERDGQIASLEIEVARLESALTDANNTIYGLEVLNSNLNAAIQTLEAERAAQVTANGHAPALAPLPAAPPLKPLPPLELVEVTPKDREREQKRSDLAVRKQTERFGVFLRDLGNLRSSSREVIVYLAERPEKKAAVKELARALGMDFSRLYKAPPTDAMKEGLLTRRGDGSEAVWQSNLEHHLTETYPDLDAADLRDKTLARLNALMK